MNKDDLTTFAAAGTFISFIILGFVLGIMVAFGVHPHRALGIVTVIIGIAAAFLVYRTVKMDDDYDPYK